MPLAPLLAVGYLLFCLARPACPDALFHVALPTLQFSQSNRMDNLLKLHN